MKRAFIDRLIDRLDQLDSKSLHTQFLRLARERGLMETVFQSIQEGIIVLDSEGLITYANKAVQKLVGMDPETVEGRPISRFFRDIDWDRMLKFDTEEWSKMITYEIEVNYPERRFLSFYVVPLSLDSSDDNAILLMLRDITQDRQQEASTLESERLNAIRLLAAGVAHEIGNPLNALNIHLQLIDRELGNLKEEDSEPIRELLDVSRKEVQRLDAIITQFLRAVRPAKPKLAKTQLETVLKETLTLLKQEIENRNIHVQIDSPATVPEVEVDSQQMKQAFFNVIKNAFQAMPDGGSLTITVSVSDQFVALSFRDSGGGISTDDFGHIFEPYHTTKEEGSGLGLMIVQRIVQDHGGAMEVHSEPDIGTTITILLPLVERQMRLLKSRSNPAEDTK